MKRYLIDVKVECHNALLNWFSRGSMIWQNPISPVNCFTFSGAMKVERVFLWCVPIPKWGIQAGNGSRKVYFLHQGYVHSCSGSRLRHTVRQLCDDRDGQGDITTVTQQTVGGSRGHMVFFLLCGLITTVCLRSTLFFINWALNVLLLDETRVPL